MIYENSAIYLIADFNSIDKCSSTVLLVDLNTGIAKRFMRTTLMIPLVRYELRIDENL